MGRDHEIRPVLVIQNDLGNKFSPTLIVSPLTTKNKKLSLATHVCLGDVNGRKSMALLEQIRTIDRCRLIEYVATVDKSKMKLVNAALHHSLDLD